MKKIVAMKDLTSSEKQYREYNKTYDTVLINMCAELIDNNKELDVLSSDEKYEVLERMYGKLVTIQHSVLVDLINDKPKSSIIDLLENATQYLYIKYGYEFKL